MLLYAFQFTAHLKQKLIVTPGKLYVHFCLFESGTGGGRKVSIRQVAVGAMPKEAQICNNDMKSRMSCGF